MAIRLRSRLFKQGYGYDIGGGASEGAGSRGNQTSEHDQGTGTATGEGHGSPKDPVNFYTDNEAQEEFPEINRPSKIRFLPPRGMQ